MKICHEMAKTYTHSKNVLQKDGAVYLLLITSEFVIHLKHLITYTRLRRVIRPLVEVLENVFQHSMKSILYKF